MVQLVTVVSTCKTTQGTHASMTITIFKSCQVHNTYGLAGPEYHRHICASILIGSFYL